MHYLFFILILLFSQNVLAAPCTDMDDDKYCAEEDWTKCDNPEICTEGFDDCEDDWKPSNPGVSEDDDTTCDGHDDDCDGEKDEECDTTCNNIDDVLIS